MPGARLCAKFVVSTVAVTEVTQMGAVAVLSVKPVPVVPLIETAAAVGEAAVYLNVFAVTVLTQYGVFAKGPMVTDGAETPVVTEYEVVPPGMQVKGILSFAASVETE